MSYESKDMKMGWQAIDGKQVPFVYPQYWSEEENDWVITSEENRLPVDAQVTGSNVESYEFKDRFGAIPSGTTKTVWESDGGDDFRTQDVLGWAKNISVFVRRSVGEFGDLYIVHGGTNAVVNIPRTTLVKVNEGSAGSSTVSTTERTSLLTPSVSFMIEATDDDDLTLHSFTVYAWRG